MWSGIYESARSKSHLSYIWEGLGGKGYVLNALISQFYRELAGADPGFQVRGGALKKIVPSGGRRKHFWGIS